MKFPVVYTRTNAQLPETAPSVAPNYATADNIFACRLNNINGWPPQRIVVIGDYIGAGTPTDVPCDLYFYESTMQTWFKMNAAPVNVKLTIRTAAGATPSQWGVIAYFDCPVLMDLPNVGVGAGTSGGGGAAREYSPGSIECMLVAAAPGTNPAGTYRFGIAGDLSASP